MDTLSTLEKEYDLIKESTVTGRYVTHKDLEKFLKSKGENVSIKISGASVEGRNIYELSLGRGPIRVLLWSQMHGNESTTTKAVIDLVNYLETQVEVSEKILERCTIKILPMLNPDGAWAYTRLNANGIDLNRDAQRRTQPETQVLYSIYKEFRPDFCFNLHDQRTIYSAGQSANPATLSFLAPAADSDKTITPSRIQCMQLIAALYERLEPFLGPSIGRYDDSFNLDCIGDTFQAQGTPTVLFEAGHFPKDYEREETRKFIWLAIIYSLELIANGAYPSISFEKYRSIPNNEKLFFDVLIKNAHRISKSYDRGQGIGILYKEVLEDHQIKFVPEISAIGDLNDRLGHAEYDCEVEADLKKIRTDDTLYSLFV